LLAKIKRNPGCATLDSVISQKVLRQRAWDEYKMAQKIWDAFAAEDSKVCTAVQPLAYIEQWNAVLMRKVEGRALKGYLLRPAVALRLSKPVQQLHGLLAAAARWLRIFHDRVSNLQVIPFPVSSIREIMDESLLNLKKYSYKRLDIQPYRDALENALMGMRNLYIPVGTIHDDFHYSNILVGPDGRVCVIDKAGDYQRSIYADLATLLTDPQTRTLQIASGGRFIPDKFIQSCKKVILEEYFGSESYDQAVLDFFSALAVLNKWSEGLTRLSRGKRKELSPLLSLMTERYFSRLLSQYL
jgi:hypothetical protein